MIETIEAAMRITILDGKYTLSIDSSGKKPDFDVYISYLYTWLVNKKTIVIIPPPHRSWNGVYWIHPDVCESVCL